jgi:hypothetical protein
MQEHEPAEERHEEEPPADPPVDDETVDTASEDSFPASDPPSYWGRETEDDREAIGRGTPGSEEPGD